jgi:protein PhnA
MPYRSFPALKRLFSILSDLDPSQDPDSIQAHGSGLSGNDRIQLASELKLQVNQTEIPLSDLGSEANRWFGDQEEARAWLRDALAMLEKSDSAGCSVRVVDSNGTPLAEGDAVTVIKDLKVKGGSSDLKRGTMIRSIHLTDDPGLIECKVDGSVLVLKTVFLKKA